MEQKVRVGTRTVGTGSERAIVQVAVTSRRDRMKVDVPLPLRHLCFLGQPTTEIRLDATLPKYLNSFTPAHAPAAGYHRNAISDICSYTPLGFAESNFSTSDSSPSSVLFTASRDSVIRQWHVTEGAAPVLKLKKVYVGHRAWVNSIALLPSATAHLSPLPDILSPGAPLFEAPCSQLLLSASNDGQILSWDIGSDGSSRSRGKRLVHYPSSYHVTKIATAPAAQGRTWLAAIADRTLQLYRIDGFDNNSSLKASSVPGQLNNVDCEAVALSSSTLVYFAHQELRVASLQNAPRKIFAKAAIYPTGPVGQETDLVGEAAVYRCALLSRDGSRLLAAGSGGWLTAWDLRYPERPLKHARHHEDSIWTLAGDLQSDSSVFCTGDRIGDVAAYTWDSFTLSNRHVWRLQNAAKDRDTSAWISDAITALHVPPNQNARIWVGTNDSSLAMYNLENKQSDGEDVSNAHGLAHRPSAVLPRAGGFLPSLGLPGFPRIESAKLRPDGSTAELRDMFQRRCVMNVLTGNEELAEGGSSCEDSRNHIPPANQPFVTITPGSESTIISLSITLSTFFSSRFPVLRQQQQEQLDTHTDYMTRLTFDLSGRPFLVHIFPHLTANSNTQATTEATTSSFDTRRSNASSVSTSSVERFVWFSSGRDGCLASQCQLKDLPVELAGLLQAEDPATYVEAMDRQALSPLVSNLDKWKEYGPTTSVFIEPRAKDIMPRLQQPFCNLPRWWPLQRVLLYVWTQLPCRNQYCAMSGDCRGSSHRHTSPIPTHQLILWCRGRILTQQLHCTLFACKAWHLQTQKKKTPSSTDSFILLYDQVPLNTGY